MADFDEDFSRRRGHRRYQSMMAQQFSTQLDDVFNMDSGLDTLVHDVETKRQSVFIQQRELEELQERIRAAEAQLGTTSEEEEDSSSDDSDSAKASSSEVQRTRTSTLSQRQPSIFAIRETKDEEVVPHVAPVERVVPVPVAAPKEYVMVRRPRPGMKKSGRVDSHIEVSSSEEEGGEVDASSSSEEEDEEESSEEE